MKAGLRIVLTLLCGAALGLIGLHGWQVYKNAQAGAQAFNYLVSPVKLANGQDVALGDILAQMAKAAAQNSQPAEQPKVGK